MALNDALSAIRTRLTTLGPALPLIDENSNERPPDGPHLILEFLGASPRVAGIGAPGAHLVREFGAVMIHVLVPRGTETAALDGHVAAICALFRTTDADGVFYDGAPRVDPNQPASEDGVFFGRSIAVDFRHDHIA
ncbi:MAG: hypothetical protein ING19_20835 [Azospirillum sp.]|nr:hypothetical protein [Azospirillum sp.]MCA3268498.1 hypothetical protein [Azospirillum sp.]